MKEVYVHPILKPDKDPHLASSYRPISLTNSISKIMEKMITIRMTKYLEANQLFDERQSGFRKNHSTIDHVIRLKIEAETAIKNKSLL